MASNDNLIMKFSILLPLISFFLLSSCSKPTKQEAIDHYLKIRFEISQEILIRLEDQQIALSEYMGNPSLLTSGPDEETHTFLLKEQKEIIPQLKSCIEKLESVPKFGDNANLRESFISYLKVRLNLEEKTMLRIVELMENGMTPEESKFLSDKVHQLMEHQQKQEEFFNVEVNFLDEFGITDSDLELEFSKRGY